MHLDLGGYRPGDIQVVCAFDIDERKVGQAARRRRPWRRRTARSSSTRSCRNYERARRDGAGPRRLLGAHAATTRPSRRFCPSPSAAGRRRAGAARDQAPSRGQLPAGRQPAGRPSTTRARASTTGVSFINCMPVVHRLGSAVGRRSSRATAIPVVGDDIKSQLGATIVHRTLAKLFADRGMSARPHVSAQHRRQHRLPEHAEPRRAWASRSVSKTEAVQIDLPERCRRQNDPHRPERLRAVAEGQQGLLPAHRGTRLRRARRSSSSCASRSRTARTPPACAIDAIRCCKLARDRGVGGPLLGVSSYFMKHPPRQLPDDVARDEVERFIRGEGPG